MAVTEGLVAIPAENLRSGCTGAEPYAPWNYRDPWEGRRCGECRHMVSFAGMKLCVGEAVVNDADEVGLVAFYDEACELFEEAC